MCFRYSLNPTNGRGRSRVVRIVFLARAVFARARGRPFAECRPPTLIMPLREIGHPGPTPADSTHPASSPYALVPPASAADAPPACDAPPPAATGAASCRDAPSLPAATGPALLSVRESLAGSVVFITGVTGYLGSLVLEQLLRTCPGEREGEGGDTAD